MMTQRQLETVSFILVALLWGYTAMSVAALPDTIPTHFNLAGEANSVGSKTMLWMFPVIATILVGLMKIIKRHPEYLNYPYKITEENRERQQQLAFMLLSGIASVIPLLFAFIIYSTTKYVENGRFDFPVFPVMLGVFLPIVIYFYFARKAR
jgi:uncharacterized membrane protein